MPAVATGANAANGDLIMIGVSGDGDSLSIGLGQLCHAIRRNVNMLYMLENNGVYGLTKGQFSASADPGSTAKKGEANTMQAIDGALLALTLGATFVARSFSGDKAQLVPIIQAGLAHRGFAFIDIISPCVTFNDHDGSTKSYAYTREHKVEVVQADFVPPADEISADYEAGSIKNVMMHDGSWVKFRKLAKDYDPTDRDAAYALIVLDKIIAGTPDDAVAPSPVSATRSMSASSRALPWAVAATFAVVAGAVLLLLLLWAPWRSATLADRPLVRLDVDLGADAAFPSASITISN